MEDKKILMVIANKDFRDEEYSDPRSIFEAEGIEVKIANSSGEESEGTGGLKVNPDMTFIQVVINDFDAIVIVGGSGIRENFSDESLITIVRDAVNNGKVVAAICMGVGILANAHILKGKKVTGSKSVKSELEKDSAMYTDNPIEIDKNIITAKGPENSEDFGKSIVNALKNK